MRDQVQGLLPRRQLAGDIVEDGVEELCFDRWQRSPDRSERARAAAQVERESSIGG